LSAGLVCYGDTGRVFHLLFYDVNGARTGTESCNPKYVVWVWDLRGPSDWQSISVVCPVGLFHYYSTAYVSDLHRDHSHEFDCCRREPGYVRCTDKSHNVIERSCIPDRVQCGLVRT